MWEILIRADGRKSTVRTESNFGSPGSATFMTMTETSTGAGARSAIGNAEGLYTGFFNKKDITKIAFVDGTSASLDPTGHNNYLIYDLIESSGNESINDILKRLDIYQRDNASFSANDTVWPNPSVLNHTAGTTGYSGLLTASGGTGFRDQSGVVPDKFCVMGINRDSDNDIQSLCAFSGNLQTGKGDSWRGNNPAQTFWSYWGDDFHSNSQAQRIGNQRQSPIGVAEGAAWTGSVYMLAFSPSAAAPSVDGLSVNSNTVASGETLTVTLTSQDTADGTAVPYTVSGVDSADINGAALTGNFEIVNNSASISFLITTTSRKTLSIASNGFTQTVSLVENIYGLVKLIEPESIVVTSASLTVIDLTAIGNLTDITMLSAPNNFTVNTEPIIVYTSANRNDVINLITNIDGLFFIAIVQPNEAAKFNFAASPSVLLALRSFITIDFASRTSFNAADALDFDPPQYWIGA